jgi:hypothetical protein
MNESTIAGPASPIASPRMTKIPVPNDRAQAERGEV